MTRTLLDCKCYLMLNITSENIISNSGLALINMNIKNLGNIVSFSCLYHHHNKIALIVSLIANVISIVSLFPMLFQLLA
jgi:hypothetical protein